MQQRSKELDVKNNMRMDALAVQLNGAMDIEMKSDPQLPGKSEIYMLTTDNTQLSESRDEESCTDQVDLERQGAHFEMKGKRPN
jgi:alkyl sulfatase BDS1-like metallo-beta-lactamase superfamily hydrolase